jgi:hypothetical protein
LNPFLERQRGLSGSVILAKGPSGTGKTEELVKCWLSSGLLTGGLCIALAPTNDVKANVRGYQLGYLDRMDGASSRVERAKYGRIVDYLRGHVEVYDDASDCFGRIRDVAGHITNDGRPLFSLLVDEGAVARKESDILATIGPLTRNLCGICYITVHRGMAVPPQIRSVLRAKLLWRSSDYTGDEQEEKEVASIEGFQYSPVMGSTPKEEQFFRGIKYTPEGPASFEYNPHNKKRPDFMLLPALPTTVRPKTIERM